MNHKLNYRRNPKNNPDTVKDLLVRNSKNFSEHPGIGGSQIHKSVGSAAVGIDNDGSGAVSETSSQLKKKYGKRTAADAAAEAGVQLMPLFVAEPSVILFSHYEIGDVITQSIMFRNISTIQRSLRVIPPGSGFFSMGQVLYPSGSHAGSVAAGIPVRTEITFYPNSLGDFADFIRVETEGGSYQVPVIAQREPPQLDIPSVLDMGACLVGDAMRVGITVTNTGGRGRFRLLIPDHYPDTPEDIDWATHGCIRMEPFTVYPVEFSLTRGNGHAHGRAHI